jgi:ComF family protein
MAENTDTQTSGPGRVARLVGPDWTLALRNFFLPVYCRTCQERLLTEENGFFCPDCWAHAPWVELPLCTKCGRPHQRMIALGNAPNFPCAECREKPNKHIDRVYGVARYHGVIMEAVKLLKFSGRQRLVLPMGAAMAEFSVENMPVGDYDLILPVPLHRVRLRQRGFNQSLLLAEQILPAFPSAMIDQSLQRIRPTRVQSRLKGPADRAANVRGAFAVVGDTVKGKTVLLIDDVVTTSGTVTECARMLKRAGAVRVDVFTAALAYAGMHHDDS